MSEPKKLRFKSSIRVEGETAISALDDIAGYSARDLATVIVNRAMNDLIANTGYQEMDYMPIPYHGWYWRNVDFFTPGGITIADGDGQVAVCESNKWDYPERVLTEDEQAQVREYVWAAYQASRSGGILGDIRAAVRAELEKAGEFISSLEVKENSFELE